MLAALLSLTACAGVPEHAVRQQTADSLARQAGWQPVSLGTRTFNLAAWASPSRGALLTVYIEGDGLAWITAQSPSDDPTPLDPVGLRMAVAQPTGAVAYLARPCQYSGLSDARCQQGYWTGERFSEPVITASNDAIDQLKQRVGARRVLLVGYSGGGAVATLLAQRRHDVVALVTVAGNVDPVGWTHLHRVTPLAGSLDPMAARERLTHLPQWHFVGSRDSNMPASLAQGFVQGQPAARVVVVDGFEHHCCWARDWPKLVAPVLRAVGKISDEAYPPLPGQASLPEM
nr:alpha/beta fold hydrolase [Pseudomonas sp. dw_358]